MSKRRKTKSRKKIEKAKLKVIPLGGLEEVGKNMILFEYGQDIIVVDVGFMFPHEEMLGVDYVIPDTSYLQKNKEKIRGVIITHGHLDHTGAIPYLLKKIGNPHIFATKLTCGLIKQRLEEFQMEKYARLSVIDPDETLALGCFKIEFFRVAHNIPDSVGLAIHTPVGLIVHTGDFKFDHTPVDQKPTEIDKLSRWGKEDVLLLCSESTNAENPGYAISEKEVGKTIDQIFAKAEGRIIIATFSSLISRIQQVINASLKYHRQVAISGLSMEKTFEVAVRLGYLKFPKNILVKINQIDKVPDHKLTIISTGSQGQEMSALSRMSRGEHRQIKIKTGDTVILSSSPIPGNERSVHNVMNRLINFGAKVIYNRILDIHASGHGNQEDLKLMISLTKPKYFMPIYGENYMKIRHAELAETMGLAPENIFMLQNGNILELTKTSAKVSKIKLPAHYVMVDGLGVGDVGNVVLRDRQVMASDGMFVIIVAIDNRTKKLVNHPDIISRGFIYMKGEKRLIAETKEKVKKIINSYQRKTTDWAPVRSKIRDDIGQFLFNKTQRRPMILPVVITV